MCVAGVPKVKRETHKQFEVSTGSKFKPSKMTPYTTRIFWFSSLQLKKAHGQSLISEDIGGIRWHAKTQLLKFQEYLHIIFEVRWISKS